MSDEEDMESLDSLDKFELTIKYESMPDDYQFQKGDLQHGKRRFSSASSGFLSMSSSQAVFDSIREEDETSLEKEFPAKETYIRKSSMKKNNLVETKESRRISWPDMEKQSKRLEKGSTQPHMRRTSELEVILEFDI